MIEHFCKADYFDVVFCINAINHVQDIRSCLHNLWYCLKPGGLCIMTADTHKYHLLRTGMQNIPIDVLHPYQYTCKDYEHIFIDSCWEIAHSLVMKKGYLFDYRVWLLRKA